MIFPDVAPSRAECQRQITDALRSDGARIYVDASVLIHCYEMSRSACEELLAALDGFGSAARVPVWSAKETWEHTRELPSKRPLAKTAGGLNKRLQHFRAESLRYVDERTFDDMSLEQFTNAVNDAVATLEDLTKRAERIEPGHDDANARLLPFIANHSLASNMVEIYAEVHRTGETRFSHFVPPGFGDGGTIHGISRKQRFSKRYPRLFMRVSSSAPARRAPGRSPATRRAAGQRRDRRRPAPSG